MRTQTKTARVPMHTEFSLLGGFIAIALLSATSIAAPAPDAEECQAVFIQISGPTSAHPSDMVRYRIEVRNEGACQIKDALVTSFLPRESRFIDALPAPSSSPRTADEPRLPVPKVEWRGVPLRSSEAGEAFDVTVGIRNFPGRVITHTACVEHQKIGRRCDMLDTFIKPSNGSD